MPMGKGYGKMGKKKKKLKKKVMKNARCHLSAVNIDGNFLRKCYL